MDEQEKKIGFMDKVKAFFAKLSAGAKDAAKQTKRRNSRNFIGNVKNIGNINVEDGHALIYAINMEDITFKSEDVASATFTGSFGSPIKTGKATIPTVVYNVCLDKNFVFPSTLKADTSVLHIDVLITKDEAHYFGEGKFVDATKTTFEGLVYVYQEMMVFLWKRVTDPNNGMYKLEAIDMPHSLIEKASCKNAASFTYAGGEVLSFTTQKAYEV